VHANGHKHRDEHWIPLSQWQPVADYSRTPQELTSKRDASVGGGCAQLLCLQLGQYFNAAGSVYRVSTPRPLPSNAPQTSVFEQIVLPKSANGRPCDCEFNQKYAQYHLTKLLWSASGPNRRGRQSIARSQYLRAIQACGTMPPCGVRNFGYCVEGVQVQYKLR
jgi:hypothetical protein